MPDQRQTGMLLSFPGGAEYQPPPEMTDAARLEGAAARMLEAYAPPGRPGRCWAPCALPEAPPGNICFHLWVRGHRIGWINGTLRKPRCRVVLPVYLSGGKLALGPAPHRLGPYRDAVQAVYGAYFERNRDLIQAMVDGYGRVAVKVTQRRPLLWALMAHVG
jgi:hypothetical protein